MVDHALTTELRFQRRDGHTIGLHAAVAAAFAYGIVDDDALIGIHHLAALATPAFFRRAGLVVNDARQAGNLAKLALHLIVIVAMMYRHARRPLQTRGVFFRLVGDDGNALGALGVQLQGDLRHRQLSVDSLSTGHRNRVVVQHFVGDVSARCRRRAHGQ